MFMSGEFILALASAVAVGAATGWACRGLAGSRIAETRSGTGWPPHRERLNAQSHEPELGRQDLTASLD